MPDTLTTKAAAAIPAKPPAPPATPFTRLGGQAVLRRVVDRFYDLMDSDPAYARLRAMHAPDLAPMRDSLTGFLAGWSGGPHDWFEANPGRCMMSIHKPFAINADTAGQWAAAMRRAIDEIVAPADADIARIMGDVLEQMTRSMVNRPG